MDRFIERNGRLFTAAPLDGKQGTPKECFSNSVAYVNRFGGTYCEGYALRPDIPMLIHHAWVAFGDTVVDVTLKRPEDCQYYGVEIDRREVAYEMARNRYYSVLDPGHGFNLRFMFRRDPGLRAYLDEKSLRSIDRRIAEGWKP